MNQGFQRACVCQWKLEYEPRFSACLCLSV